jgi:hypothetical protein
MYINTIMQLRHPIPLFEISAEFTDGPEKSSFHRVNSRFLIPILILFLNCGLLA